MRQAIALCNSKGSIGPHYKPQIKSLICNGNIVTIITTILEQFYIFYILQIILNVLSHLPVPGKLSSPLEFKEGKHQK